MDVLKEKDRLCERSNLGRRSGLEDTSYVPHEEEPLERSIQVTGFEGKRRFLTFKSSPHDYPHKTTVSSISGFFGVYTPLLQALVHSDHPLLPRKPSRHSSILAHCYQNRSRF
jgi:hypothetical protein